MNFDLWRKQELYKEVKYWTEQVSQSLFHVVIVSLLAMSAFPEGPLAVWNTTHFLVAGIRPMGSPSTGMEYGWSGMECRHTSTKVEFC